MASESTERRQRIRKDEDDKLIALAETARWPTITDATFLKVASDIRARIVTFYGATARGKAIAESLSYSPLHRRFTVTVIQPMTIESTDSGDSTTATLTSIHTIDPFTPIASQLVRMKELVEDGDVIRKQRA